MTATDLFTDPLQVSATLRQLQAQLNDLAKSMAAAAATGQTEALAAFKAQFRVLAGKAAALRVEANAADAPNAILRALDAFSDASIALGKKVGAPVGDLFDSAGAIVKLAPYILVALLLVAVYVAYKGHLSVGT